MNKVVVWAHWEKPSGYSDGKALVISQRLLECQVNIGMSKWLNEYFAPKAFSSDEMKYIVPTGEGQLLFFLSSDDAERWLFDLMEAAKEAGVYDDTDFFLTSDHGQLELVRNIKPNVVFADNGLIEANPDGTMKSYKAYCYSTGLSAQIVLSDPSDSVLWCRVYDLLNHMKDEGIYGISRVYTAEEIEESDRLAGNFSFVIESDGYTSFAEDWNRPMVKALDLSDYRFGRATHGHYPDKGPQPVFFGFGPDIRAGVEIERRPTVDEAPTYAKILGVSLPDADGRPVDEMLR